MADIFHKKMKVLSSFRQESSAWGIPFPKIGAKIHFWGSLQTELEGNRKDKKFFSSPIAEIFGLNGFSIG